MSRAFDPALDCPGDDHDAGLAPIERLIESPGWPTVRLCGWCAEGLTHRLLRQGYPVTIRPVQS